LINRKLIDDGQRREDVAAPLKLTGPPFTGRWQRDAPERSIVETMTILTIIAIILGPLLALWLQRMAENSREKKQNKFLVFKTLMTYRATPLNYQYVQALNLIDVVFNAKSHEEKAVRAAWSVLLDHLNINKGQPDFARKNQHFDGNTVSSYGKMPRIRLR
jgi:hypothetical protein